MTNPQIYPKDLFNLVKTAVDEEFSPASIADLEAAVNSYVPTYGGWCAYDVIDVAFNEGYELPFDLADEIIEKVVSRDCEVTWDRIQMELDDYDLEEYLIDEEERSA